MQRSTRALSSRSSRSELISLLIIFISYPIWGLITYWLVFYDFADTSVFIISMKQFSQLYIAIIFWLLNIDNIIEGFINVNKINVMILSQSNLITFICLLIIKLILQKYHSFYVAYSMQMVVNYWIILVLKQWMCCGGGLEVEFYWKTLNENCKKYI